MADSNTDRLGLIQMEEGGHSNEWGDIQNINTGRIDAAARGFKEIVVTTAQTLDATDVLSTSSTAEEEAFFHWIEFTGTPGVTTAITVQAEEMGWCVLNNTDSIINFTPSGGTLTALAVGKSYTLVYIATDTAFTDIGLVSEVGTVATAAQPAITSVGTLTSLAVTGEITGAGFTGTLDGTLGSGTPAAATVTTLAVNGDITTDADGTDSIGATAKRWLKGWFDSLTVTGDVGAATGTFTGVVTGATVEATGDTSAGDNSAMGYTAAEGLILTGQGSTNDVTIKNDTDADVISIPTGTTGVTFAGDVTINSNVVRPLVTGTVIATTSGTAHGFTSIPSWVTKITLTLSDVSIDDSNHLQVQIGDSGGYEATSYSAGSTNLEQADGIASVSFTTGFGITSDSSLFYHNGIMTLTLIDAATFTWVSSHTIAHGTKIVNSMGSCCVGGGSKSLSATLDRIQLTTTGTPADFDSGKLNILYE